MTQDIDIMIDRVAANVNTERLVSKIQSAGYSLMNTAFGIRFTAVSRFGCLIGSRY